MTTSLKNFSSQIQRLTYQLIRYQDICDRVYLEQLGITSAQAYALLALPEEASLTMNNLSETMGLANSTMTRTVDQLVIKKLVEREPDPDDRRVVRIRLTANGRETQRSVKSAFQDFFEQALREIPSEDRETVLQSLGQISQAIANGLEACTSLPIPRY